MNITKKVIDVIKEISGNVRIKKSDHLQEDLALDSLDLVTLLVSIEDVFSIELDESDMNPFDLITVNDVIELVEKYTEDDNYE